MKKSLVKSLKKEVKVVNELLKESGYKKIKLNDKMIKVIEETFVPEALENCALEVILVSAVKLKKIKAKDIDVISEKAQEYKEDNLKNPIVKEEFSLDKYDKMLEESKNVSDTKAPEVKTQETQVEAEVKETNNTVYHNETSVDSEGNITVKVISDGNPLNSVRLVVDNLEFPLLEISKIDSAVDNYEGSTKVTDFIEKNRN